MNSWILLLGCIKPWDKLQHPWTTYQVMPDSSVNDSRIHKNHLYQLKGFWISLPWRLLLRLTMKTWTRHHGFSPRRLAGMPICEEDQPSGTSLYKSNECFKRLDMLWQCKVCQVCVRCVRCVRCNSATSKHGAQRLLAACAHALLNSCA